MARAASNASTSANGCCRPLALMTTAPGRTASSHSGGVPFVEPWWLAFRTFAASNARRVSIHHSSSAISASPGNSIVNPRRSRRTPIEQLLISSPPAAAASA